MTSPETSPRLASIFDDIDDAADAGAELIGRGREAWDDDRLLRLAGEAVIGRIADAANRLPDSVKEVIPDVPWDDIRGIRILVDHIYHRIDYDELRETLDTDVPHLRERLRAWRSR
ncbi:MAG: hypothetical protein C0498_12505 [Anaerolinea sp.]|nr:hypothetical protein [Anaerolinea sp.]